jgi:aspartyl-tRNA(Asn)/glutamyl-tRNA(Gln) amidotransferase subunit C
MTIDVKRVAKLANLSLSADEEDKYSEQLSKILEYIDKLNEVDTENVEPTYNVTGLLNVMRPDEVGDCVISEEEATKNAAHSKDGFFVTKGVFIDD